MVLSLAKGRYCLGCSLRESGQRRVPEPPERIPGIISRKSNQRIVNLLVSIMAILEGKPHPNREKANAQQLLFKLEQYFITLLYRVYKKNHE